MDMDIISSSSSSQRTLLLHVITKRKRNFKTSTFPSVISHENHIWIWGLEFLQNAIAPWTACKFSTRVDSILQLSEWWTGASVVWHSWHVFIIFGSRPHNKDVQYRFDVTRHTRDGVPRVHFIPVRYQLQFWKNYARWIANLFQNVDEFLRTISNYNFSM